MAVSAVPTSRPYQSPEVHSDGTVTFRILAPEAKQVTVEGGWMASHQTAPLVKDAHGLWSLTVGPLKPTVYAYWFNLDGAVVLDEANETVRERTMASSVSTLEVPAATPLPWSVRDVPHGTVATYWVKSPTYDGETRNTWVYLPPGYETDKARSYPVLYLFHGSGELHLSWVETGKANLILDNLLAEGKIKPMIVVMPYVGPPANAPLLVQGDKGPPPPTQAMRYVRTEMIPWAEAHFRTLPGRRNRAIAGLSAGGALAGSLVLNDPDLASQLGMFSAPIPSFAQKFPTAASNAQSLNRKLDLIWMGVGRSDPQIGDWVRQTDQEMTKAGLRHTFVETDGAHDYAVWRWCLIQFAPLLFKR